MFRTLVGLLILVLTLSLIVVPVAAQEVLPEASPCLEGEAFILVEGAANLAGYCFGPETDLSVWTFVDGAWVETERPDFGSRVAFVQVRPDNTVVFIQGAPDSKGGMYYSAEVLPLDRSELVGGELVGAPCSSFGSQFGFPGSPWAGNCPE